MKKLILVSIFLLIASILAAQNWEDITPNQSTPLSEDSNYTTLNNGEICDNGIDDDGDGLVDCEDPDCFLFDLALDGLDTDNDGLVNNCDLDDDNDGITDTDEALCQESGLQPVNPTFSGATADYGVFQATYTKWNINQNNLLSSGNYITGYNGIDGIILPFDAIIETSFSVPVMNIDIAITDLDSNQDTTLEIYDENNQLIEDVTPYITYLGSFVNNVTSLPGVSIRVEGASFNTAITDLEGGFRLLLPFRVSRIVNHTTGATQGAVFQYILNACYMDLDTDGDGIPDFLDTDSDADGCPDAIEGDAQVQLSQLDGNYQIEVEIDTEGIPIILNGGQGIGSSKDSSQIGIAISSEELIELDCGESQTLLADESYDTFQWQDISGIVLSTDGFFEVSSEQALTLIQSNICEVHTVVYTISEGEPVATSSDISIELDCGESQTLQGDESYDIFIWKDESGNVLSTSNSFIVNNSQTLVLVQSNDCEINTTTIEVNIGNPDLDMTFQVTEVSCAGGNDGSIEVSVNGSTGPYSYLWNTGDNTHSIENLSAGVYTLEITDSNECTETVEFEIVEPLPLLISSIVTPISCNGQNDGSVDIMVEGGSPPYTFHWSDESLGNMEDPENLAEGEYTLTVTDSQNCIETHLVTITDETPSIQELIVGSNFIEVSVAEGSNYTFSLDGLNYQSSNLFTNLEPGIYTVYVNHNQCIIMQEVTIIDRNYFLFNTITPNADGINDFWNIPNIENYTDAQLQIYDRYGKVIFESLITDNPVWDGFYLGRKLPAATYWYIINLKDGNTLQGYIAIKNSEY